MPAGIDRCQGTLTIQPKGTDGVLHAAPDALFDINATRPLKADEIEHIDVELAEMSYLHGWWPPQRAADLRQAGHDAAADEPRCAAAGAASFRRPGSDLLRCHAPPLLDLQASGRP